MSIRTANQLRALLDRDANEDGIVTCRSGLINRAPYARRLGVTTGLLCSYYRDILSEYEEAYLIANGPLAKFEAMRAWLEEAYNSGKLGIRDGRVDRTRCMQHVEIKGRNATKRFPQIRELLEEFDRRVEKDNYIPTVRRVEFDNVKAWLSHPVLNKDHLTINRHALAVAVGIEITRLKDPQCADAIVDCEAKIAERAHQSRNYPPPIVLRRARAVWTGFRRGRRRSR